jgi:hypothetical protein
MRFTELRQTGLPTSEENERAKALFPRLVQQSRLHLWSPGDPIDRGRRLLVGVATWSLYDLSLLDVLDQVLAEGCSGLDRIDLFDLDEVEQRDFDKYVPGLGKVVGTPVAGHWENAILGDRAFGWQAIQLTSRLVGVSLTWNGAEWRWEVRGSH